MNKRNCASYVAYESVFVQTKILADRLGVDVAYRFRKAIDEYGLYGIKPENDSDLWLYGLEQIFTSISSAKSRYDSSVENGKQGGRPKKDIDIKKGIRLHDQEGYTWKDVAKILGCSEDTLRSARRAYLADTKNLETNSDNFSENQKNLETNSVFVENQKNLNDNVNVNVNDNQSLSDLIGDVVGVGQEIYEDFKMKPSSDRMKFSDKMAAMYKVDPDELYEWLCDAWKSELKEKEREQYDSRAIEEDA